MPEPSDQHDEDPTSIPDDGIERDLIPQLIAKLSQDGVVGGVPITLSAHGQLITGLVIGKDAWFEKQSGLAGNEGAQALFGGFADSMRDEPGEDRPANDFGFLHLEQAAFMTSPGWTRPRGLIRLKISSIDAYMFGTSVDD